MCDTKVVAVSIPLILLVAGSFCIYQAHTEIKVGHQNQKSRSLRKRVQEILFERWRVLLYS